MRAGRKKASPAILLFPPTRCVAHTLRQSLQYSFTWKKEHESEQGRGRIEHTHKKKSNFGNNGSIIFKKQGFGLYFGKLFLTAYHVQKLSSYLELSRTSIFKYYPFSHKLSPETRQMIINQCHKSLQSHPG